jgi:hypothetical protein
MKGGFTIIYETAQDTVKLTMDKPYYCIIFYHVIDFSSTCRRLWKTLGRRKAGVVKTGKKRKASKTSNASGSSPRMTDASVKYIFFSRVDLMLILFNLTVVKVPRRTVVFICFEIGKKLSMRWSVAL